MRSIYALVAAALVTFTLLFTADRYLVKNYQENHRVVILNTSEATPPKTMSQDTALHLIHASFKVITPTGSGTCFAVWTGQRNAASGDTHFYTYLVTCAHVVKAEKSVIVQQFRYLDDRMIYATTSFGGDVVSRDVKLDLALIEVQAEEPFHDLVTFVQPSDLKKMRLAEPVYTCGCGLGNPPYVANAGNIANFNADGAIQVTSPIIFGNSGGGVYTADGKLLGVTRAIPWAQPGQVYPEAGLAVPVWTVDLWLIINGYGFVDGNEGSSIDNVFEAREKAQKELQKLLQERALEKLLEDLRKEFDTPPLPEVPPAPDHQRFRRHLHGF